MYENVLSCSVRLS